MSYSRRMGLGKFGLMVLLVFLVSPEGDWRVQGLGLGREAGGTGRIAIQEQDLSPSPFKAFLEQDQEKGEVEDGVRNNNRFASSSSPEWETVIDPKLYIITEYDENSLTRQNSKQNELSEPETSDSEESAFARLRRNSNNGHSLSIVNPLDVLRQRLLLEIARRRNLKQNQHQIIANAEILKNIG